MPSNPSSSRGSRGSTKSQTMGSQNSSTGDGPKGAKKPNDESDTGSTSAKSATSNKSCKNSPKYFSTNSSSPSPPQLSNSNSLDWGSDGPVDTSVGTLPMLNKYAAAPTSTEPYFNDPTSPRTVSNARARLQWLLNGPVSEIGAAATECDDYDVTGLETETVISDESDEFIGNE